MNWADTAQRLLLDVGSIGEIRRADDAFIAEVRGPMHRLDEERGRLFRATCSADLGDGRCGIDVAAVTATGEVAETDGEISLTVLGLGQAGGWFTGGALAWTSGANAGISVEVRTHRSRDGAAVLDLWQRTARPIAVGDGFEVTAGCDKRFETCREKFANTLNFRGFPHMPGNDFVARLPKQGEPGLDGGSLFR